ncbi:MAG: rod shape-determining protein MreD [Terracidiphilus sp.]
MPVLTATNRRELEVHRFPALVYALVPLVALVLQAWLPRLLGRYSWFDLPLLVVVYFALGRPSPIQGTLMGCILGIFEDALTQHPIGINGVVKTLIGFLSSSLGIRVDVDNHTVRVLLVLGFSLLSGALYFFVYRILLGLSLGWNWRDELFTAFGNGILAFVLFPLLDRFRQRD